MKSTHLIIGARIGIRNAKLIDKAMIHGYQGTLHEYTALRMAEEFATALDDADAAQHYRECAAKSKAVAIEARDAA